jgi:uncharacterized membrane protein
MGSSLFPPILIILVSVPLIFEWIPRNGLYGFRTPRTLESDAVWYPANKNAGILFTSAGVMWLLVAIFVPGWPVQIVGVGLVIVAAVLSFVSLSRILIP